MTETAAAITAIAAMLLLVAVWAATHTCTARGCHLYATGRLCDRHTAAAIAHYQDISEDDIILPERPELSETETDCLRGQAALHADYTARTASMWTQAGIPLRRAAAILDEHGYTRVADTIHHQQ